MKQLFNRLLISLFLITMFGCAAAPPSETVFTRDYKHRIVRAVPIKHGRVTTVKVHHNGPLSGSERDDIIRWYKSKHHRPNHRVKVVFIRN